MNYYPMKTSYLTLGPITQKMIGTLLDKTGSGTDAGGHSLFLGQVRADKIDGKSVVAIEYSAYEEMVKNEADKLKQQILSEFPDAKSIDIIHSTGIVRAGEISLAVIVSAGHRRQAIDACSKAVELIKERFPVWKKEIFEDNSYGWKENSPV
jgi:molybdopterin synthase catalytic subunit